MHLIPSKNKTEYLRNFVFGVEDSLVSTVGLISGIAVAGLTAKNIILTGVVLVFVEAFSMGVGTLLSENSADEYQGQRSSPLSKDFGYALVMFISYLVSGFIIVIPYALAPTEQALTVSIIVALLGLFVLGTVSAKLTGKSLIKKGLTMSAVGGLAILLGISVGSLIST